MSVSTRLGWALGLLCTASSLTSACGRGTATELLEDAGHEPVSQPPIDEGDAAMEPLDAAMPAEADAGTDAAPAPEADASMPEPPPPEDDAGMDPPPDAGAPPEEDDGDWIVPPPGTLAPRPPMGWSSWNKFGCAVSEQVVRAAADALVASGMQEAGYEYVNIDDCWQTSRASNGAIVADANTFPSGIKALADYVHSKGLKLGIHSSRGLTTCAGRPGSQGYEALDAKAYASWGVDYLKYDSCNAQLDEQTQYQTMRSALADTGRAITFNISAARFDEYMPELAQLWRTTGSIQDSWNSVLSIADTNERFGAYARPSAWNDPDMLEVGNGGMTTAEYRAHFSLWAMMAAPLIAGNDLATMSEATRTILTNDEVIAVDQDPLGYQGYRVRRSDDYEVWTRPLQGVGVRAVLLLNRSGGALPITVKWTDIGLMRGMAQVRNLWAHGDHGMIEDQFTFTVPSHDAVMLKVTGAEPLPPRGNVMLSDLQWTYAANGWGPVELNRSVGDWHDGDGKTLSIAGTTYEKGLGVHAGSLLRYRLGKQCTRFRSDIGVDDEMKEAASVVFHVLVDGEVRAKSEVLRPGMHASVDVDVTGGRELKLLVTNAGDGATADHADWANARLDCAL